jgi:hypothetical protein
VKEHWDSVVQPLLEAVAPAVVVEVGVFRGATTELLLGLAASHDFVVHSIDPEPAPGIDVEELERVHGERFTFHRALSLDALGEIADADAVILDGDHNWYTVFHELRLLERNAQQAERPFPLTMLHDIGWPYARRDLYYSPETVPAEFRHPHEVGGLLPGDPSLHEDAGINAMLDHALSEGTPRNGILTAIEDFLSKTPFEIEVAQVPGFAGLGVLVDGTTVARNDRLRELLERFRSPDWLREQIERVDQARLIAEADLPRRNRALQAAWEGRRRQRLRADAAEAALEAAHARIAKLEEELREARKEIERLRTARESA